MKPFRTLALVIILQSFISCAKTSYLFEQGTGQVSLMTSARDNQWVLDDPKVPPEVKEKIRHVQKAKKYFEKTWNVDTGGIYTQTTFLDRPAVTYLLIRSPHDRVTAIEECFPFLGCFPYIGFYDEESANSWKEKFTNEHRFVRPVYAYSTLGYLSDPILSSFFHYDAYDLTELVFHELFHTMFFVESEVALNENLATYFGREMAVAYFREEFHKPEKWLKKKQVEKRRNRLISQEISKHRVDLNKRYKNAERAQNEPLTKGQSAQILSTFMNNTFRPQMRRFCRSLNMDEDECYPLDREWNNASLSAYETYNQSLGKIAKLQSDLGVDFKGLYTYIQKAYKHYLEHQSENGDKFAEFLFSPDAQKTVKI